MSDARCLPTWPLPPDTCGSDGRLVESVVVNDPLGVIDGIAEWAVHVIETHDPRRRHVYVCVPSNGDEVVVVPEGGRVVGPGTAVIEARLRAVRGSAKPTASRCSPHLGPSRTIPHSV